ncbi:hypothetical protein PBI_TWEETY_38 [Mycobacterium phage Tweety]|uniref:Uncharacterized protein n=1 Tax=Mycobacterium phage Tweety TaxID=439809 RepID=A5YK06_9CAUD|nr:hypothetical protein PBI_TWEETY_38 [Mycobacterium phage Tweety]ABQ86107.1 hypothetical protein PBI_TWEETY_38 [Mycobacterium phage Tweety]
MRRTNERLWWMYGLVWEISDTRSPEAANTVYRLAGRFMKRWEEANG